MNTLGVILARAGSQGLSNKHLRMLGTRPVISYSFEHARLAKSLTRVVVSTDCEAIKRLARADGLEVVDRPTALATSDASVQDVMLHAMKTVERDDPAFCADALVVIYGNVPLRPDGVIDRAVEHLEKTGCDSVRSFCPVGKWNPAWMSRLEGDRVIPLQAGSIHRRQDLAPVFLHEGAGVAVSRESMLRGLGAADDPHAFFGVDRRGIETQMGETVEVDTLRDLYLADAILRERSDSQPLAKAG